MELNLTEELLLLFLDDKKGREVTSHIYVNYGLAGAILSDLVLIHKIDVKDKKIIILNSKLTNYPVFDDFLKLIRHSHRNKSIKYWARKLGYNRKIKKKILKNLIIKGILKKEESYLFGFIPIIRYPAKNLKPKQLIKNKLYKIIIDNKVPDEKSVMLISLIGVCKLTRQVFKNKEDHKIAKQKIKTMIKDNKMGEMVNETIKNIHTALISTIATSAAVASR